MEVLPKRIFKHNTPPPPPHQSLHIAFGIAFGKQTYFRSSLLSLRNRTQMRGREATTGITSAHCLLPAAWIGDRIEDNTYAGSVANFIDEWSQCDLRFTYFGVILEYLESIITTKRAMYITLSWGIHEIAVAVRWLRKLKSMMAVID